MKRPKKEGRGEKPDTPRPDNALMVKLTCEGCAHSVADLYKGLKSLNEPSGERPCQFCIRNPELPKDVKDFKVKVWYDGSKPVKLPMDCYHSVDMLEQIGQWQKKLAKK